MKVFGLWLLAIGVVIAAASLLMPTTAPVEVPASSLYGMPTRSDVYNLGLLQQQMMVFVIGCALAVLGGALAAVGHLGDRLLPPSGPGGTPAALASPVGAPDDTPTSVDHATNNANSEIGWIIGVGAVALLFALFAILAGTMAGNSGAPAAGPDLNITDEMATDNMTAVDGGAMEAPIVDPSPKATKAPEPTPAAEGDSEIGRDNWEGE